MDVTERQWNKIKSIFKEEDVSNRRGRPPTDPRKIFCAVLWVFENKQAWRELPSEYRPYQTVHRTFCAWCQEGKFERALTLLETDAAEFERQDKLTKEEKRERQDSLYWKLSSKLDKLESLDAVEGPYPIIARETLSSFLEKKKMESRIEEDRESLSRIEKWVAIYDDMRPAYIWVKTATGNARRWLREGVSASRRNVAVRRRRLHSYWPVKIRKKRKKGTRHVHNAYTNPPNL